MEFWLTAMAPGSLTSDEYDAWLAGDRDWTSDHVRRIFQNGPTATPMAGGRTASTRPRCSWTRSSFQAGEAANVIGLMSDVAHWKDFGEFLGDDLGVLPPLAFEGGNDAPFFSAEGGVGYSVTTWSPNPELAEELALAMANTDVMTTFFEQSGAIVSDTTVDLSRSRQRVGDDAHQRAPRRPDRTLTRRSPPPVSTPCISSASSSPPARSASTMPSPRCNRPTRRRCRRPRAVDPDETQDGDERRHRPTCRRARRITRRTPTARPSAAPRPGDALPAGAADAGHHRGAAASTP